MGLSQRDTVTKTVILTVTPTGDTPGVYGDLANAKYWIDQEFSNCTLNAGAMAVAQVNETVDKPTQNEMIALAQKTPSVSYPGNVMYQDNDIPNGATAEDVAALIKKEFGLNADMTAYTTTKDANGDPLPPALQPGQVALTALEAALARGDAAMVGVASDVLWSAAVGQNISEFPDYTKIDHQIVVIQVNLKLGKVYVNDSSGKAGMEVPIGAFLNAWSYDDYQLVIVSKPDDSVV